LPTKDPFNEMPCAETARAIQFDLASRFGLRNINWWMSFIHELGALRTVGPTGRTVFVAG